MEKVKIYNTKLHKSRLSAVRLVILYSSNKNKEYNMIYSVASKIDCSLTVILSSILNYGKIDIKEVEIIDYKEFRDGEKSFVLIGDGRKLRPALERLVKLNGRSNFDWCCV